MFAECVTPESISRLLGHLWYSCPGFSAGPEPRPGRLLCPEVDPGRSCCPQHLATGEGPQLLPVLTPEGSRPQAAVPAGTPRARVTALNRTGPLFQNRPSGQQSLVCEGSAGLCEGPCLPWHLSDFSTGWPALFRNWLACSETLFFEEKNSWTWSRGKRKKKVRIIIKITSSQSRIVRVWKY